MTENDETLLYIALFRGGMMKVLLPAAEGKLALT